MSKRLEQQKRVHNVAIGLSMQLCGIEPIRQRSLVGNALEKLGVAALFDEASSVFNRQNLGLAVITAAEVHKQITGQEYSTQDLHCLFPQAIIPETITSLVADYIRSHQNGEPTTDAQIQIMLLWTTRLPREQQPQTIVSLIQLFPGEPPTSVQRGAMQKILSKPETQQMQEMDLYLQSIGCHEFITSQESEIIDVEAMAYSFFGISAQQAMQDETLKEKAITAFAKRIGVDAGFIQVAVDLAMSNFFDGKPLMLDRFSKIDMQHPQVAHERRNEHWRNFFRGLFGCNLKLPKKDQQRLFYLFEATFDRNRLRACETEFAELAMVFEIYSNATLSQIFSEMKEGFQQDQPDYLDIGIDEQLRFIQRGFDMLLGVFGVIEQHVQKELPNLPVQKRAVRHF